MWLPFFILETSVSAFHRCIRRSILISTRAMYTNVVVVVLLLLLLLLLLCCCACSNSSSIFFFSFYGVSDQTQSAPSLFSYPPLFWRFLLRSFFFSFGLVLRFFHPQGFLLRTQTSSSSWSGRAYSRATAALQQLKLVWTSISLLLLAALAADDDAKNYRYAFF